MTTPRKLKGTTWEFKATSGGVYAAINKCTARQLPQPKADADGITALDDPVVKEANTINDWGELVLSILYDQEDTVHTAMRTAVGGDDCYVRATLPTGRKIEYTGNAKEFGDKQGGPKDHARNDFKMHVNAVPTETAPP